MHAAKHAALASISALFFAVPCTALSEKSESYDGPEDILLWVSAPVQTTVGERVTLMITVENARRAKPFHLEEIDIAGSYLNGFAIVDVQPTPEEESDDGDQTLSYRMVIPPQSSQRFYITLKSVVGGVFIGDVDVYGSDAEESGDSCTARAQTKVAWSVDESSSSGERRPEILSCSP